jgi:hypothetical protein
MLLPQGHYYLGEGLREVRFSNRILQMRQTGQCSKLLEERIKEFYGCTLLLHL